MNPTSQRGTVQKSAEEIVSGSCHLKGFITPHFKSAAQFIPPSSLMKIIDISLN